MKRKRILQIVALLLGCMVLMGEQCPPIPEITEKTVELALAGSIILQLEAEGIINVYDEVEHININDEIDLAEIIEGTDIDPDSIRSVRLSGAQYRVTVPDPNPGRQITNGNVTVQRGGGPVADIVDDFSYPVSAPPDWITAPLVEEGVDVLNGILDDLLDELQGGPPITDSEVDFHVSGVSEPQNVNTSFEWELKLIFTVVGAVTIDFVEF